MAFPFQKVRCAVGGYRMLFPFRQLGGTSCRHVGMSPCFRAVMLPCLLVGMMACRHTQYLLGASSRFPHGLVDECKSVEVLNIAHNTLVYCLIHAQLVLNKHIMHNKQLRKEKVMTEPDAAIFPLHRPFGVVGILLRMYFTIYQHYIISIQQFNRISEALQQSFGHGVIPAHVFTGIIASVTAIHVGGIGKPVGCR